jgi:oligopeptide transport system ATP-binding protein
MTDLLAIRDLQVCFSTANGPVFALNGLDLALRPGETIGLVGESGSGKSVTLRAILRLLRANAAVSGQIIWRGEDLLRVSEARMQQIRGSGIGMIFQEPMSALNPVLTIGQQIDESLVAHGKGERRARRKRAIDLLTLVGIPAAAQRLDNYPHEFSGGMRQRAMIAIVLAAEPKLLLADEPTTALDVTIQDQILKLLKRLVRDLGMAMILVTHDLGVVAETCDRVLVMYAGRVVESAKVERLFSQPRHAYTLALLRSVPQGLTAREPLQTIPGQAPRLDRPVEGCAFLPRCAYHKPACSRGRPPLVAVGEAHLSACLASAALPAWTPAT